MSDYKAEFLQEAREYVELMNQSFLRLEKGDNSAIDEIFRAMHTIKGMAGFMGYKNLENLCHRLESFLSELKGKEVSEETVDLLLLSSDRISEILNKIEAENSDEIDCDDILDSITSLEKKESKTCEKKEGGDSKRFAEDANLRIEIKISDDCAMKGVRGLLILEALKEVCEIKATEPEESKIEEGCDLFLVFANGDAKKVDEVLSGIAEIERYTISETGISKKERKEDKIEEKTPEVIQPQKKSDSVRVDVKVLDTIMNLIGELVIIKGRLLQISGKYEIPELSEAVSIMEKSITSLQDEVMKVRMVKVERVFSKFPRMVRDLARKLGKKVEFVMEGLDTELDRTVLDEMSDPIMHLIRNAVDHGIESPEERKAKGKSETGLIKLSARREKNNVVIEIEDDGRGIDLEKIRKKAIERGLISESAQLSEEELKNLIFLPGFSTNDRATEISGRGVGMDVVKTTVERLGGSLKLISEKDRGTKIRINLPPTVAIIKSLLVSVGGQVYAIPLSNVVEAVYVDSNNAKNIHGNLFLIVRGKLIPSFRLSQLFGCENGKEREVGIIVEKESEKYALIADSIIDQQEIVVKPLTGYLSKIKGFSGVTILGDGTVVPIIDISSLLGGDKFG
ncbi:MAG: two-component system, chemotaxis family, sensor kinase CheA [Archaeoglobaceae archaeon]|nr:two-component system, chemotaxis family, sensor kinase CheA [Archaeoglobaceae archaeon]MDK2875924.1 two-component system, chemotaxis family, sensor kinase CheA [Archaeoglobaceae archaeon]